jgi:hypothetical protein
LKHQSGMDNFKLLVASDDLLLEKLFEYVQCYLIEQQSSWIQQNFVLVLNDIFNLPNFKKLQEHCIKFVYNIYPIAVFNSSYFPSLDKYVLFYLLKQDDFRVYIEEVIIWNSLIKWGIKQTPELENKNKNELTNGDYQYLKNTLSTFIPLIRFTDMNSDDFYDKVRPYEAIIPNNIYDEVMSYYLVKQSKLYIYDSKIVKPSFGNIIANFIDRKVSGDSTLYIRTKDDPIYKFELNYRGRRDCINDNSFRDIRRKGLVTATLILIKTKELDKIFAGYSSVGFNLNEDDLINIYNSNYFKSETFILSFKYNDEDIQDMKISYADFSCCTGHTKKYTSWDSGCDALSIIDQKLHTKHIKGNVYSWKHFENVSSWRNYYKNKLTTTDIYTIEEIEVYDVVKLSEGRS